MTLLTSVEMARFVARGFLRFDAAVPDDINAQFMAEAGAAPDAADGRRVMAVYAQTLAGSAIAEAPPGRPLADTYPADSALGRLLALPRVAGAFRSLLGEAPVFDHHFLHITFPPSYHEAGGGENVSQHTHQDSTIDPRLRFDVQLMYYPHEVTLEMGGTRFVPGTHLRKVSEVAIGRYQNIRGQQHMVCPAGTLLFLHHGLWHGGGVNRSDRTRYMFKIRAHASGSQVRQWDARDLNGGPAHRPIFFRKSLPEPDTVETILMASEPWFEQDTGRLEYVNRVKLWRYVTGDTDYDADYWMTRLENVGA
ncbi:MAG: phytanoyl-CoA dioxygenase family protein [Phenylobacterium sp.]|uniref:phytanoyl-CoA dioxygenase family protein n=1 Tax=Phenylobacterium sp. TaxID=1871053 RepID=UPI001A3E0CFC|nr:phytanoyl-CoA dioxygenase family protein [Phenylobacterium sp.]MBL8555261.1 phytanoyl-CoA dioxygenase family protein [Phenylobacterium sp.]